MITLFLVRKRSITPKRIDTRYNSGIGVKRKYRNMIVSLSEGCRVKK